MQEESKLLILFLKIGGITKEKSKDIMTGLVEALGRL